MSLQLFDGNNYARIQFSVDTSGQVLHKIYSEVAHNGLPTIVVFDGKNAKESRRKIFPGYKVGRPPAPDGFYRVVDFWKELLRHTHAIIIEIPGYEADDVIGYLVRSSPGQKIEIKSNDRDFCVLLNENVTMPGVKLEGVEAHEVRLYKTLVGDSSDKVPGIKGFGPGKWEELTELVKTDIIKFLNGEQEWTNCLRLKSHNHWVSENSELLKAFWAVVDFLPLSPTQVNAGMQFGKPNPTLARSLLADQFQLPSTPSVKDLPMVGGRLTM